MRKSILISLFALLGIISAHAYDFEVGGLYYNIINSSAKEVEVTAKSSHFDDRYSGTVVIPSSVTYNKTTYKVTTIGEKAFNWCADLTSVKIPEGVTSIGESAFSFCTGLTTLTLPKSVTSIGKSAFSFCSGLTSVTSLAKTPPSCHEFAFGSNSYYTIPLYVPAGSRLLYVGAQGWRKFVQMEELQAETYTVTVKVNDASMGRVTGGGTYAYGTPVSLVAIPNTGYHFVKWDDGVTTLLRTLMVTEDITLTAIFAKNVTPTANEDSEADNFRVYVQDRTIYLSEDRGLVQVYNMAGQCIYNGHATAIPIQQPGVYILRADGRSRKILVK